MAISIRNGRDIESKAGSWLWFPYIPYGKVTLLQGTSGVGKTSFALAVCAESTNGKIPMLVSGMTESDKRNQPILYLSGEDNIEDYNIPRFLANDGDLDLFYFIDESENHFELISDNMDEAFRETGAKLFVIDSIQAFIPKDAGANGVREILRMLSIKAKTYNAAILCVSDDLYNDDQTADVGQYRSCVPVILQLKKTGENILLSVIKNNCGPIPQIPLRMHVGERVKFEEFTIQSSETKIRQAVSLINAMLSSGPQPMKLVNDKLEDLGITPKTAMRARHAANTVKENKGGVWYLRKADE